MSVFAPLQRKPQAGAAPRASALGAAVRVQRESILQKAPTEAAEPIAAHASPRCGTGSPACECLSCAAFGASDGGAGAGAPLPDGARRFFESRFGHNFSKVRVFDDAS